MVRIKSEWKDVRAVFWFALCVGIVIGWVLASVVVR